MVRGRSPPGRHRLNRLIGRAAAAATEAPKPAAGGPSILAAGTGFDGAGVAAAAGDLQSSATCFSASHPPDTPQTYSTHWPLLSEPEIETDSNE